MLDSFGSLLPSTTVLVTEDFKRIVEKARESGFDLMFQCDIQRESVYNETLDDVFLMGNLLQFPYGRGGMDERRIIGEEDQISDKLDVDEYIQHISRLSLPQFHRPLFCLGS